MLKSKNSLKPLACLAVLFLILGLTIANATLTQLGLQDNNVVLFSLAFGLAMLLLSRNWVYILLVLVGVAAMNMPASTLQGVGLDRDLLIALVCAVILLPSVYSALDR